MRNLKPAAKTPHDIAAEALAAEARRRNDLRDLAWKAVKVRGIEGGEQYEIIKGVVDGTVTLDPAEIDREVEEYIGTVRLHEECKGWVRRNGYALYHYRKGNRLPEHLCEGCAKPLTCSGPTGAHAYRDLSPAEARARGIYHAGRCYHVSLCDGCGHVQAVDSSD